MKMLNMRKKHGACTRERGRQEEYKEVEVFENGIEKWISQCVAVYPYTVLFLIYMGPKHIYG